MADLLEKWHGFIPKGTNRESIWNQRFAPLAAQTRSVYILDHYAAANFADELRGAPGSSIKGPAWFLGHLARTKVKRIHLACSSQPIEQKNMTVAQASELLTRWMRDRNPRIELRLHFERYFDHGRRVAFDGWAGFGIHNGLATFDHPELTEMLELHADAPLAQAVAAEVLRISPFMT
ncbi:hypothetical protein [Smaragdicoccus niigatensis]|uniref:hypothetical protein n=1 Tax=Smaragdicoccus niigatensis TaxID=359359 RepID=UPI0012DDB599|nr:hypothetical protein [Smaragdicoccus niigatensis]